MIPLMFQPILLAWLIAHFTPLNMALDYIFNLLPEKYLIIRDYLTCMKCWSLWLTLIMTGDPFLAIAAALVAYTYLRIMGNLRQTI